MGALSVGGTGHSVEAYVGSMGQRSEDAVTPPSIPPLIALDAPLSLMHGCGLDQVLLRAEISHIVCGVLYCRDVTDV